jgi:hypothetical protein
MTINIKYRRELPCRRVQKGGSCSHDDRRDVRVRVCVGKCWIDVGDLVGAPFEEAVGTIGRGEIRCLCH